MEPQKTKTLRGNFEKTYKFAHLPSVWMGESFTKAHIEVIFLTRDDEKYRLYQIGYKAKVTSEFLKNLAKRGIIQMRSGEIIIENEETFIDEITRWEETETEPLALVDEFACDLGELTDRIYRLQKNAKERGLVRYEF